MNTQDWPPIVWRGGDGVRRVMPILGALAGLLALLLALAALDFHRRLAPTQETAPVGQAAVFTGQFYRIPHGLALLDSGQVGQLLVSGVNQGAGLSPEGLVARFASTSPGLEAALATGRLELDSTAQNTFGNAREAACWYRRQRMSGPLLLITSRAHMPRASVALEAALPRVEIRREPVDGTRRVDPWRQEFLHHLAARILLLDPRRRVPDC